MTVWPETEMDPLQVPSTATVRVADPPAGARFLALPVADPPAGACSSVGCQVGWNSWLVSLVTRWSAVPSGLIV